MKLLPKREIDTKKASERKLEIDEGLSLAKSVDALREQLQIEKKNLLVWREENIKQVQYQIGQFIEERDNLEKQNNEARKLRDSLLAPLDKEWVEINQIRSDLTKDKERLRLDRESTKLKLSEIEKERNKVTKIVETIKLKQNETDKAKSDALSLRELAQREYEMAHTEHVTQSEVLEQKILEVSEAKREYEVALCTIGVRENEVKEKEVEIIKREKDLEKQQMILRIAREATK